MFGKDRGSFGPPNSNDELFSQTDNLLDQADQAHAQGSLAQASHLYLAAYESSASHKGTSSYQPAIDGLRNAWDAACALKDRALAEHVFEKLEGHLQGDEIAQFTEQLQRLALDKLEEFGFTREDLQDMADMVSEDFMGALREGQDAPFAQVFSLDKKGIKALKAAQVVPAGESQAAPHEAEAQHKSSNPEEYTYADLVGFDHAIDAMHKRGIGFSNDPAFSEFMASLSRRHGISSLPSVETLLFRSPSREDANQFMWATAQEMHLPSVRMFMEETPMGFPVLCVMTSSNFKPNVTRGGFDNPGVLILEDVDLWGEPFTLEQPENEAYPAYAYMSRGARDAVMFIRAAVENPNVLVMATVSSEEPLDEFFIDLLGPIDPFDIDMPDEGERALVWNDVCSQFPSLRQHAGADLVRLSANLSRSDIYVAAREAVDQAFRSSIETRSFVPVSLDNLFNKIAAFQPLDSSEYQELEESAVASLRLDMDAMDTLLEGTD